MIIKQEERGGNEIEDRRLNRFKIRVSPYNKL